MQTYRAAGWLSDDKQSSVRLTTEDQSNLPDEELIAAAKLKVEDVGLEIDGGQIVISSWSE